MRRVLSCDGIKLRRTWIMPLVVLGPAGVVGLTALRYLLGYRGIVVPGAAAHNWALLLQNIGHLLMPSLVLGVTLLAALITGLDHDARAWTQLAAAPVPRVAPYASKFVWTEALLALSATLTAAGTLGLGLTLGFHAAVPWGRVLLESYYPYLAATGIVAIQLLVSTLIPNQGIAVSMGVLGVIMSGLSDALAPSGIAGAAHWAPFVPWVYPSLSSITHGAVQYLQGGYVIFGLAVGLLLGALGARSFALREVL